MSPRTGGAQATAESGAGGGSPAREAAGARPPQLRQAEAGGAAPTWRPRVLLKLLDLALALLPLAGQRHIPGMQVLCRGHTAGALHGCRLCLGGCTRWAVLCTVAAAGRGAPARAGCHWGACLCGHHMQKVCFAQKVQIHPTATPHRGSFGNVCAKSMCTKQLAAGRAGQSDCSRVWLVDVTGGGGGVRVGALDLQWICTLESLDRSKLAEIAA